MVRSIHKINISIISAVTLLTVALLNPPVGVSADTNVNFNVNLAEVLTVSIINPTTWASGNASDLLRNKVTVTALTNNANGSRMSMYVSNTDNNTRLKNTTSYNSTDATSYIDTLDADTYTYSTFPAAAWGYSFNDADTPNTSASYLPIKDSDNAITVFNSTIGTTATKDIFFGAKSSDAKQSGTYAQTVYFAAVTGKIDTDNPAVPVNPAKDVPTDEIATYDSSANRTTYTRRSSTSTGSTDPVTGDKDTTTTQVNSGNTTSSSYATPAGVTTSTGGSNLAIAFAVAAGVTAISGTFFFILAKRRSDDDEEEEEGK